MSSDASVRCGRCRPCVWVSSVPTPSCSSRSHSWRTARSERSSRRRQTDSAMPGPSRRHGPPSRCVGGGTPAEVLPGARWLGRERPTYTRRQGGGASLTSTHGSRDPGGGWSAASAAAGRRRDPRSWTASRASCSAAFGGDFRVRGELERRGGARQSSRAPTHRGERVAVVLVDHALPDEARAELLGPVRTPAPRRPARAARSSGAPGPTGAAQRRSCRRWRSATSTTTCSSRGSCATSSSTARSPSSCRSGRAARSRTCREIVVVADRRSARAHEIRSLLTRNGIPHAFRERGSALGRRRCSTRTGVRRRDAEVVVWMPALGGTVAARPDRRRGRRGVGGAARRSTEDERDFDVLVVGAGPAGLAAAVYASSEGLQHPGRRAGVDRRPGRAPAR